MAERNGDPVLSMPAMGSDWASEVEQSYRLPTPKETVKDGIKTRTEVIHNERGDKIKVVSTFKVITKRVPKAVAARSKWGKFGACRDDPPGPQVATTTPADEVLIQFIRNRGGELLLANLAEGDGSKSLRDRGGGGMHCRHCKMNDHYSIHCPYKDMLGVLEEEDAAPPAPTAQLASSVVEALNGASRTTQGGAYVPPSMRGGAARLPVPSVDQRRDENTVRVTNLPEDTTDQDLRDLFSQIGRVQRIYLAKDKQTMRSKGFAFVTYERRDDAEKAILTISGHKYDYVILKVEWAQKSN